MAAPDFNYEEFAQNLAAQAHELVPPDFDDAQKDYVIQTLGNFSMMAGKALAEDKDLNFNAEQSVYITQIIAEWSFHKSVDVIRSGIPRMYWDSIMQKIAYTIFEIAKQAFAQNLPNDQIIELIEHHVNKTYVDAITELKDKGVIDDELMKFAASQSNMNKMAQEMQQQAAAGGDAVGGAVPGAPGAANIDNLPMPANGAGVQNPDDFKVDSRVLKLATVALVFKRMSQDKVQTILNKFDDDSASNVIKYMQIPDLQERVGVHNALRCLQDMKSVLPKDIDLTPLKVVTKIKKFAANRTQRELETLLIKERLSVKKLVFMALEDNYYDKIPPKIASIIATHLQDSV